MCRIYCFSFTSSFSVIGNMLSVQGMGEFLDEMAMMMSQTKPNVCFKFTHLSSFLI